MSLSAGQCVLVLLIAVATRGFYRGWHREIVTCAVTLGTVFFLTIGGGDALSQLLFGGIPGMFSGHPLNLNLSNPPASPWFNGVLLAGFTVLAHLGGSQYGAAPKTTQHRLSGMVAGTVTGLSLAYYITNRLLPSTTFSAVSPNSSAIGVWVVGLFGFGMALLLFLALIRK